MTVPKMKRMTFLGKRKYVGKPGVGRSETTVVERTWQHEEFPLMIITERISRWKHYFGHEETYHRWSAKDLKGRDLVGGSLREVLESLRMYKLRHMRRDHQ